MQLNSRTFDELVADQAAAVQAANASLVDWRVGSVLRALAEAFALIGLWLQSMAVQVLRMTRAATSSGDDLDSWVGDYGLVRLPAVAASGDVTFGRLTATVTGYIPAGTKVQTDTVDTFTVIADTGNAAWNAGLNAYVMGIGIASLTVKVQADVAGVSGNVASGAIHLITGALPGIDTVTNAAAFVTGVASETDAALRMRFVAYIASLSKATKSAVGYAVTSTQQGMSYAIVENEAYGGAYSPGYFYVVIDDGTGSPSGGLISSVANAIEAVRPLGVTFGVFAPTLVTANVVMTVSVAAGYSAPTVKATVQAAIQSYINKLALGAGLTYTRLAQIAYDASPAVTNVSAVTLNTLTADIAGAPKSVIRAGTVTIS